ncbi:MAG TPA: LytTR family DNA-binding domain-containing protein [Ferruginibacter sp.]|jgi:two-component system LytT family response regulator|nr:LytTR family DNA-binding domain-containing protein [Ferruginibacter sp.]
MINCLIVDDELHAVELLVHFAKQVPNLNVIKATTDPVEALLYINEGNDVQLIFSDIQMADVSGLDIAKAVKGKCKLIFVTAYSEFALQGYENDIVDYLLKPVSFPRFLTAVQKAENMLAPRVPVNQNTTDHIYVKMGVKGKLLKINLIDIDYIESNGNYIYIYHEGIRTLANSSMKEIESKLPASMFIRVHKSYVVSIDRITGIEGNKILLKKNIKAEILLGDTYRSYFFENINKKTLG